MAKKRTAVDAGQWLFFSVACVCVTYALVHLNLERVEGWIAVAPGVVGLVGQLYSMSRGRAVEVTEHAE